MVFGSAEWIWRDAVPGEDEYVDFLCCFPGSVGGEWRLRIAADSNYTAYLNGQLAAFGQYPDYPDYKVYDDIDISWMIRAGENRLVITVWYYGRSSQTYIKGEAGLIFEVVRDGRAVAFSSAETLSRLSRDYVSGRCRNITYQLGFTYTCDLTRDDGYIIRGTDGFKRSRVVTGISRNLTLRPVKKLELCSRMPAFAVKYGSFSYTDSAAPPEVRMQKAEITDLGRAQFPLKIKREPGRDGVYVIADLGKETAGFLDLDIELPAPCEVDIGYGEHLTDGRCRTSIGNRSFTAQVICRAGANVYMNTFRRFGCRYVQLFVPAEEITINYLGIRPTVYPVKVNEYKGKNAWRRRIWEVCVNTLRQCMHEHYEDCPWREQALYTMDSRNQMLCGYFAFEEYEFAWASLVLISKGVRPDGLLSLCYPVGIDYPIPSFSLVYFLQVNEYIKYSGDLTLAAELYGMLQDLMQVFLSRIDETGLIKSFAGCWNFYEWSRGMSGKMVEDSPDYEAPLNAFLALGLRSMAEISEALGHIKDAEYYRKTADEVAKAIGRRFYNHKTRLFESYDNRDRGQYSVLTNSLCLLCGAAEGYDKSHILRIMASNGADNCGYVTIPNTLSMNSFRFDALLAHDPKKYAPVILAELDRDYGYMLERGATSFWETIEGEEAFKGAGSLCHGWSALPIYYYSILENYEQNI
ncbi:MAG: family 78 glycoside hydrolase catalytic domain [Clostridiales bacterium]|nr:family 78 glycoside hydrolase catalytic domain [Clostridiales bacterium]